MSTVNTRSALDPAKAASDADVRLNVTGVDAQGQMFRHAETDNMLDGRECVFRSKSEPELDGSVLAEFDYSGANPQRRTTQARVKSTEAESEGGPFKVVVELEFAQSAKVGSKEIEIVTAIKKPAMLPVTTTVVPAENKIAPATNMVPAESKVVPPTVAPPVERKVVPAEATREFPFPVKPHDTPEALQHAHNEVIAPLKFESREPLPKSQPVNPTAYQESIKSAVATEIKQEMNLLKSSIKSDVEKALPAIVASNLEKLIRNDVEKQISASYESSIQALNANVARLVRERLANSQELRAAVDSTARELFEAQAEQSRAAGAKVEQELNSRAAAHVRTLEQSIAAMEARINATRAEAEAAVARAQSIRQEINESMLIVQEGLKQIRNAEQPGIEKMQAQAAIRLQEWATQFENLLSKNATDKAVQFSLDMERRMAPHRQRADETAEKLGAMLQLLQGTVRVEQERLSEHSRAAAASIEREIQAFLVRLGGGASKEGD